MKNNIHSICAAPDWLARFKIGKKTLYTPLACWALTKAGKLEGILPDDDGPVFATTEPDFQGYVHEKSIKV